MYLMGGFYLGQIFYTVRMEPNMELTQGNWLLVLGSRKILPTLLKMIGRLMESGPVRLVDAGLLYDPFQMGLAAGANPRVLKQIKVSHAYSCRQLLDILDGMAAGSGPFIILNILNMFFDPFLWVDERK
jgi:hypothetical protein